VAQFNLVEAFDPEYTSDLEHLPMERLRAKRDACAQLETDLSYLRRLAQARIDLILAESQRRHSGGFETEGGAGAEDLVHRLPQILSDHGRQDGPGRLPSILAPAEGDQARLSARVEEVLPSDQLGSLDELTPGQLDDLLRDLSELERRVSGERRALHDIQDRLQEELVRRYRSGEATVDALLR
jgi:vacuolar-type H+-ATPase subunit I/STV1